MNTKRMAEALNTIAVAFGELAEAIMDTPVAGTAGVGRESATAAPSGSPAPTYDQFPPMDVTVSGWPGDEPQGSLEQCPRHRVAYRDGKFGKFCPSQVAEGDAWGNAKGYCTITPKNASTWLRQQAAVA